MDCPSCGTAFTTERLDGYLDTPLSVDICRACQLFWFDARESLQLSAGATLALFRIIGDASAHGRPRIRIGSHCPRCGAHLLLTHDLQRNTPFSYWRCEAGHGRLITFYDFLREKDFIRPLSPAKVAEMRQSLQTVNCSNCGAPIDLARSSVCTHCGSPLSMLDLNRAEELIRELQQADRKD